MAAGYSGTPLIKYFELLEGLPPELQINEQNDEKVDFIHFFVINSGELYEVLPHLKEGIVQNGMIWVSWPKKASKVHTDITEDTIRDYALSIGLVDIKVCAVDEKWSGLKLVIRLKDRT